MLKWLRKKHTPPDARAVMARLIILKYRFGLTDDEFLQLTSIAVECHRALIWLRGLAPGNHWAETPTDT
jgi:hypothetical protein